MGRDAALSELIGHIYDCTMDKRRWPAVLGEICSLTDALCADVSVTNPLTASLEVAASHNIPKETMRRMQANVHLNPLLPVALVHPLGEPFCISRSELYEPVRRSAYYNTCLKADGHADMIGVPFSRNVADVGYWHITRHESRGLFGDDEIELARLLTPHIRRSVEISRMLDRGREAEAGFTDKVARAFKQACVSAAGAGQRGGSA